MDPALTGLAGVAVTALVAYVVQLRRLSGDIQTSEASALWAESTSIRETYAKRMADLEKRVADLERDNNDLRRENLKLASHNLELERDLAALRERCEALARENAHLKTTLHRRLGGFDDESE